MENKDHIHAASSINGDYMYTIKDSLAGVNLYSLFFKTKYITDFIGNYQKQNLKYAEVDGEYNLDEKITFYNLLKEIAEQAEGKSDISQGNYFNHPSLDEDDIEDKEDGDKSPSYIVRKDIKVTDQKTAETMIIKKLPDITGYDIYYSEHPISCQEVKIGEYIQNKWRPIGNKQVYNYELLNELLNQIEKEIMQNKRPTTKEERESEGLPGQDAYEAGLMDGKKQTKEEKAPLYRISLKANNGGYQVRGLYGEGDYTEVVNETNNPEADELIRKFVESMKGIGFMEETVHQAVIEIADEFSGLDKDDDSYKKVLDRSHKDSEYQAGLNAAVSKANSIVEEFMIKNKIDKKSAKEIMYGISLIPLSK